uniref:Uncharacterized protein n=1 Tax=Avena sativa TaxID=4498 RepID=A0ACD5XQ99_AVESA
MDGVRSLAHSLGAGDGGRSNLFRTLGPALFISIGYIDLGKWVTTIDAGSRFGYDLVLLVLLFNFSAVLCQYLSICIGMVTTKNLAQICVQEYSQPICAGLGVQAIISFSAAVGSGDTLLLTFQDVVELMNQIFMNPAAPLVFLVVLLLSSHIISLSSIIGSHAIVENFFGVNLSLSAHHLLLKAMLLPSSVIPVFRVASSRSLMGSYRISSSVEILAFLAFLLMLFTNIIFMAEILFGDSTWTNNMKGNTGSPVCEAELLQSLRLCIIKILKVEGSGWLFRQSGGCDENLIDQVAAAERFSQEKSENPLSADLRHVPSDKSPQPLRRNDERATNCVHGVPNCGETCVWQGSLVVSFGVWCIRRVLDLSLVESRPELWGKYTYVLNRLQGVLEPAFSKPRKPLTGCACLQIVGPVTRPISGTFTTAAVILETIKDVEQAISGRKGRNGTAAGDVAFPKGKENLASVLKRYKRRLASKPSAGQ